MHELLRIIESLKSDIHRTHGKSPVKDVGFLSCANAVDIKHVPFYGPCIITVLTGRKVIFDSRGPIACEAGCTVTVPAPSSFDLRNEPDREGGKYRALVIPFTHDALERLAAVHGIVHESCNEDLAVLKYEYDDVLNSAIKHYLTSEGGSALLTHRLMEVLLVLVGKNPKLLSYVLSRESWSQRVRAVLATELAHPWSISEVCGRLATSESTLRRNLQKERVGFREILSELRLTTALMRLLQTSHPVSQVAYDCGFQSMSRFSANFHKRFGLPPRHLRETMNEAEQELTAADHSLLT